MTAHSFPTRKFTLAAFVILLLGFCLPPRPASAQSENLPEFPQKNAWTRVTPSVVWCGDPSSKASIEVHITGRRDVRRVWVTDLGSPDEEARLELYDDGTQGDAKAGDNVFSRSGLVLPCPADYFPERGFSTWWGFLRVELADGTRMGNNYGMTAGLVDPKYKKAFAVHDFSSGLSATAYAFFIVDSQHEVMNSYPVANVTCGTANYNAYRKLYSVLPDAFDFALVMPGMQIFRPQDLAENVPYEVNVSNSVQHIGMDLFDNGAKFGSAGRLKSVIYHSFGDVSIVDHEMGHAWGMDLGPNLGLVTSWEGSPMLGHWNELSDIAGQMSAYYFDDSGHVGHFSDNGDGTWRLIPNTDVEPYSPLELYAMGLIPPEEVPPLHILKSPDLRDPEHITAASYKTVTIDQIMRSAGGPRSPASADAQKAFSLAFVVTQDTPFNDAAYAFFSLLSYSLTGRESPKYYSSYAPFYWATGGRGTLDTRLPVDVPEPAALPGAVPPTPEPTSTSAPEPDSTPALIAPTEPAGAPSAAPTRTSKGSPLCGSTFAAGGMVALPGAWLLLRRRRSP